MTKFSDLNLNPKILKAIEEAGYETPTPIQAEAQSRRPLMARTSWALRKPAQVKLHLSRCQ